jgi:hypothetical protein
VEVDEEWQACVERATRESKREKNTIDAMSVLN